MNIELKRAVQDAAAKQDAAALNWIERQHLEELGMGLVIDAPNDGMYYVCGDSGTTHYGKTLREALASAIQQAEAKQVENSTATPEPVEDGIRNAVDELNCAEEVLDAITCEFSDGEFPMTDFNCIGDYITAVVGVFKERLAAQQPATSEPVASRNPFASRCYTMSESHLSGHRLIVGFEKLGDAQDAHEWVARQGRGDFTHPAPSVPNLIEKAISSGCFGVLPVKATIPMCKAGWGASGGELTFQQIGHIYEEMYKARPLPDDAIYAAPSVPDEKPLPDLMMALYHEAIGWNACRAAMLAAQAEH